MKILNISTDPSALDKNSTTAKRLIDYGRLTDKYAVIVPSRSRQVVELSNQVKVYGSGGRWRPVQLVNMWRAGRQVLAQDKFRVITTQDPFETALIGWLLARRFKLGLNIQEHGDFFSAPYWRRERILHWLRFWLGKILIRRADSVRAVSQRIARTLIKMGVSESKIVVVPVYTFCPVLKYESKILQEKFQQKLEHKFIFLTMARFVKQKNLGLLIKAFNQTTSQVPHVALVIIGQGPEKYKLVNLIKTLGLADKVFLHDWVENVFDYYLSADAYVLSSNYEGWGRVIIEAAWAGLPIVTTDVGCAKEVIKNEISGLVVPVGDEQALAQAMVRIAKDKNLRQVLAQNALKAVRSLPNKEQTLKLYKKSWQLAEIKF